jgi:hypothetical protein
MVQNNLTVNVFNQYPERLTKQDQRIAMFKTINETANACLRILKLTFFNKRTYKHI